MRKITQRIGMTIIAASAVGLLQANTNGKQWTSDFAAAQKQAEQEKKSLLLDFTGSDWCGWCIKLREEVFDHDAFSKGVKDKFVLVELDFPQNDSILTEETKKQNAALQQKYEIQGYPTIILTDPSGRPFAMTGYQQGGAEQYVSHLDELLAKRKTRDEAFEAAEKLEGVAKAKALTGALQGIGLEQNQLIAFYADEIKQIQELDPNDETGFTKEIEAQKKYLSFQEELNQFAATADLPGALKFVEETLKGDEFSGNEKQEITMIKGMIHAQLEDFEKAIAAMEEAKKVVPESPLAEQANMVIEQIKSLQEQQNKSGGAAAPQAE